MDILKHVDILDLITITVYNPNLLNPREIQVDLKAIEEGKHVVVDEDSLVKLNEILTEKCKEFKNIKDPKIRKYIEEFVGRMCSEWHRHGLLIIEDIPEAPEDPYEKIRKQGEEDARRKRSN